MNCNCDNTFFHQNDNLNAFGFMTKYETIFLAIQNRRSIHAYYGHRERILSPHAIGEKNGRIRVLCLQTAGESRRRMGPEPEKRWRDIWINLLTYVRLDEAPWQTASNYESKIEGRYDSVRILADGTSSVAPNS